mgnify:CR=1 FL=1
MGRSTKDSHRKSGSTRTGSTPAAERDSPAFPVGALLKAFEENVIPSLLEASRQRPLAVQQEETRETASRARPSDVNRLAQAALEAEHGALHGHINALRARGFSLEAIFLDLLAPAARRLGKQWERDQIDFVAVTTALGRIHQVVRELSAVTPPPQTRRRAGGSPRILLAVTPGEQHNLGLLMVAELFQREGWEVVSKLAPSQEELIQAVEQTAFDAIGLSLGSEVRLNALISTIGALRTSSKNPDVGVMVGGAVFALTPEIARRVPADAVAADAASAVRLAETLLRQINLRLQASRTSLADGHPTPSPTH